MKNKKQKMDVEDIKIYPDVIPGRIHGAFSTQAVTDPTERFEVTNAAKPSDENVDINREWVIFNKK